jgi:hypothetical protein
MKKMFAITMFMIGIFGLISLETVKAGTPVSKSIRQTIVESVAYPDEILGKTANETIILLFKLTDDGKIEIKQMTSGNDELSKYVTSKISKIRITDPQDLDNKYYKIKLTFQTP